MSKIIVPRANDREKAVFDKFNITLIDSISEREFEQVIIEFVGGFRQTGRRDVAIVTHIEHPYEVTLETARAVDRLKRAGLCVD